MRAKLGTCFVVEAGEAVRDIVMLRQIFRYWPWTTGQLAQLLADIQSGRLLPLGRSLSPDGLGGLLFERELLRDWFSSKFHAAEGEMTITQVAVRLDVKQEVAYALVRAGLLETSARQVGRRTERCVSAESLAQFERRYVFGRDVARQLGCSPKAAAARLADQGVAPVAGPTLNGCRQLLFERANVMAQLTSSRPSSQ